LFATVGFAKNTLTPSPSPSPSPRGRVIYQDRFNVLDQALTDKSRRYNVSRANEEYRDAKEIFDLTVDLKDAANANKNIKKEEAMNRAEIDRNAKIRSAHICTAEKKRIESALAEGEIDNDDLLKFVDRCYM
jgi:hypothetical protein